MFVDPLGAISVSLPPVWGFDPSLSSLTRLAFRDWTQAACTLIFVVISPGAAVVPAGSTDDEWESAICRRIREKPRRVERRPGPLLLIELPGTGKRPDLRTAWVRGARLDILIEQQSVKPGRALQTPGLFQALQSLYVPVNERMEKRHSQADFRAARDAAAQAMFSGDAAAALEKVEEARKISRIAWLRSLVELPFPDLLPAFENARMALAIAERTGSVEMLRDATQILFRCRISLPSGVHAGPGTAGYIEERISHAMRLHGRFGQGIVPDHPAQACLQRAQMFLERLATPAKSKMPAAETPIE